METNKEATTTEVKTKLDLEEVIEPRKTSKLKIRQDNGFFKIFYIYYGLRRKYYHIYTTEEIHSARTKAEAVDYLYENFIKDTTKVLKKTLRDIEEIEF